VKIKTNQTMLHDSYTGLLKLAMLHTWSVVRAVLIVLGELAVLLMVAWVVLTAMEHVIPWLW
jgi:hypothetical protein